MGEIFRRTEVADIKVVLAVEARKTHSHLSEDADYSTAGFRSDEQVLADRQATFAIDSTTDWN